MYGRVTDILYTVQLDKFHQVSHQLCESTGLWFFDTLVTKWERKYCWFFSVLVYFVLESSKYSDFTIYLVIAVLYRKIFPHFKWQKSIDSTAISLPHTDTEMPFCSKQRPSEIIGTQTYVHTRSLSLKQHKEAYVNSSTCLSTTVISYLHLLEFLCSTWAQKTLWLIKHLHHKAN